MPSKIARYFGIRLVDDGAKRRGFILTASNEDLTKWRDTGSSENALNQPVSAPEHALISSLGKTDRERDLIKLFLRFRDAMGSSRSVVGIIALLLPTMQHSTLIHKILPFAERNLTSIETTDEYKSFSCDAPLVVALLRELRAYNDVSVGFSRLPSDLLLSVVATFDSFFVEIVKSFLSLYPERYASASRTVGLDQIARANSIQEILDQVMEDDLQNLMRGSHGQQVDYVEKHLGIKIIDRYQHWGRFVEVFERRNLVAHGDVVVNETYLSNCKAADPSWSSNTPLGSQLTTDANYLYETIDFLTEFGVMLIIVLWLKHVPESQEAAFVQLNELSVDLIRTERHKLAIQLLRFGLEIRKPNIPEKILRMMTVNLANAHKKSGDMETCRKTIEDADWSATSDYFALCLASLKDDAALVIELMPKVFMSGSITASSFRDWPVLDWVRSDPAVVANFEKIYGEPLLKAAVEGNASEEVASIEAPAQAPENEATL